MLLMFIIMLLDSIFFIASAVLVNIYYPDPHMDEIFHVRQLEAYLRNDFFVWDPKITTLPGLYIFSYLLFSIIPLYTYIKLLYMCRILNSILLALCGILLKSITPSSSFLILYYPPLFMSSILYYTDTISLLSILIVYYFIKNNQNLKGSLFGLFSVFCRQTNIIWVGYIVGNTLLSKYNIKTIKDTKKLLLNWKKILKECWPYIVLLMIFIIFLKINQGIVVGDRENHKPGFHLSQLLYLSLLTAIYTPFEKNDLKKAISSNKLIYYIPLSYIVISNYTYAHQFLLSDNSHYVFYLWKNILSKYGVFLAPVYAICLEYLQVFNSISALWWFICCGFSLVPSTLLELRYFIIPLAAYIIENKTPPSTTRKWLIISINLLATFIFLTKPYKNIGFMW